MEKLRQCEALLLGGRGRGPRHSRRRSRSRSRGRDTKCGYEPLVNSDDDNASSDDVWNAARNNNDDEDEDEDEDANDNDNNNNTNSNDNDVIAASKSESQLAYQQAPASLSTSLVGRLEV
ncbi:hypothetical protein AWZ03_009785 [Drosophila navojoa]|uniref:Uncharacterized protein n=1 Tax=Drosophila navojoa TaxID=7232 RepID=A0A484B4X0_DRONA|nr:hypothetical protein AWZ03_009785 [Drosophila navojoa]